MPEVTPQLITLREIIDLLLDTPLEQLFGLAVSLVVGFVVAVARWFWGWPLIILLTVFFLVSGLISITEWLDERKRRDR